MSYIERIFTRHKIPEEKPPTFFEKNGSTIFKVSLLGFTILIGAFGVYHFDLIRNFYPDSLKDNPKNTDINSRFYQKKVNDLNEPIVKPDINSGFYQKKVDDLNEPIVKVALTNLQKRKTIDSLNLESALVSIYGGELTKNEEEDSSAFRDALVSLSNGEINISKGDPSIFRNALKNIYGGGLSKSKEEDSSKSLDNEEITVSEEYDFPRACEGTYNDFDEFVECVYENLSKKEIAEYLLALDVEYQAIFIYKLNILKDRQVRKRDYNNLPESRTSVEKFKNESVKKQLESLVKINIGLFKKDYVCRNFGYFRKKIESVLNQIQDDEIKNEAVMGMIKKLREFEIYEYYFSCLNDLIKV